MSRGLPQRPAAATWAPGEARLTQGWRAGSRSRLTDGPPKVTKGHWPGPHGRPRAVGQEGQRVQPGGPQPEEEPVGLEL